MTLASLETPIPLVDLDRLEGNLDRMAAYTTRHGLSLRPHVKTHKSPQVAAWQRQRGATGVSCATPRELEAMATVCDDLLLAYPPVGAAKIERLLRLPEQVRLTIALDAPEVIDALGAAAQRAGRTLHIYVELDVGMHRVGVPAVAQAIALAHRVQSHAALRYAGLTFYPGHIREPGPEQDAPLATLRDFLGESLAAMAHADVAPPVVSGGSTPMSWRIHEVTGVTEVRPGTYVYNDRTTAAIGVSGWDDCALTVLATVVSTAVPGQAVVDAGTKALGREPMRGTDGPGYGVLLDRPEVFVSRMSEEHGILDLSGTDWRPTVGDQVRIIPNHVCIVTHLFDEAVGIRGDTIHQRWPIAARGR